MELMVVAVLFYSIDSLQRLILLSNRTAAIASCSLISEENNRFVQSNRDNNAKLCVCVGDPARPDSCLCKLACRVSKCQPDCTVEFR